MGMVVKRIATDRAGLWQFPCIPGFAEFFLGSVGKIPGSALTGLPSKVIDSKLGFNAT
jgi:hypothetical protein